MEKKRLDVLLTEKGLAKSRERARAVIMSGAVRVDGKTADKAGACFAEDADITVEGDDLPYVSRGGLKLEKAICKFGIALNGLVCADIGASTGGFTDCMLQKDVYKRQWLTSAAISRPSARKAVVTADRPFVT